MKTYHEVKYQLTPTHAHLRNMADGANRYVKTHLIVGLCSVNKTFPMHLWDRILPHATMTLNMMQTSCCNYNMSYYTDLEGYFDYNATPLTPPGT